MYIAFKWLLSLAVTMWATMCCIDVFRKSTTTFIGKEFVKNPFGLVYKNHSIPLTRSREVYPEKFRHDAVAVWHCTMFISGALAVFILNKKKEIVTFTMSKIAKLNMRANTESTIRYLKKTACAARVTIINKLWYLWEILQCLSISIGEYNHTFKRKKVQINYIAKFAILKKLKEIVEERKNLGLLLISALNENKTIRMQYQLETMANTRLARNIENTQKLIKDNRSRYISFQQLYLVTHQENIFLKSRVRKLKREKDEAEKNLMGLMNEIYMSKNNELKAYCSRFIVRTRDNLLNSDVNAEIEEFLHKARCPGATTPTNRFTNISDLEVNTCSSRPRCTDTQILLSQNLEEDNLVQATTIVPKLRGLPGEYVWTIKDKDGIIEKLYEYNYESDFDNGDTIRRIRQYSVYYDKDCLLDFSSSRTAVNQIKGNQSRLDLNTSCFTTSNEKFLTGSEVFKKFLQTNKNVVSSSAKSSTSSLLCR